MEGGIHAWKGETAEGFPEPKAAYFAPATRPEAFVALAWYLEHGSEKFYSDVAKLLEEQAAKDLFRELAVVEEHHQASLEGLYEEMSGSQSGSNFPASVISSPETGEVMEGGIRVDEAVKWMEGKKGKDIVELSITLEANSYDLYTLMERRMDDARAKRLFALLADEEKSHLNRLTDLFEKDL
jgi:rubrerythrin